MLRFLITWLCCVSVMADTVIVVGRPLAGGGGGPSYLLEENFDGAGTPSGWTTATGTPNYDYTTTILQGTQSLALDGTSADAGAISPSFTAPSTIYGYCLFRFSAIPSSSREFMRLRNSTTVVARVFITSSGNLQFRHGATTYSTVSTMSINTTYHIWYDYAAGSGANGVSSIGFSTDGTRPTSGNAFASNSAGAGTLNIDNLSPFTDFASANGYLGIFDRILADDVQIGNSP